MPPVSIVEFFGSTAAWGSFCDVLSLIPIPDFRAMSGLCSILARLPQMTLSRWIAIISRRFPGVSSGPRKARSGGEYESEIECLNEVS